jgi:hypothetical protein
MLSGTGYPSGTGMELFFYPHAGTGNPTGKILRVQIQVRVGTTRRVRTPCHLESSPRRSSRLRFRSGGVRFHLQKVAAAAFLVREKISVRCWKYVPIRLPALMDLYIYPLYVLVSKILSSILNSPALIHPLYHPLSTLSTMRPTCHFI